ncbi:hypothetical protein H8S95_08205 [Pontibacter sp. KCTC 32443]|uniref:hypothetical protein n=1 Tax=Pontibacter TaxID=323449 RepID=UPI00164D1D7C|nr:MULTISPECIES: hypothetical protein [Pontibacter]MBC5774044.1 hypothetical protein [Pontibacter sp. KCTC 32443]
MKDRLKDFVSEHRDDFDVYEPRPELWQEICQELSAEPKETTKVIKFSFGDSFSFSGDMLFMRVAAAVILLLGCGLTLWLTKQNAADGNYTMAAVSQPAIQKIAPELVEVEAYYTSQLKDKKEQLSEYDLKVLGLDEKREIDSEIARLDSSYIQLKKQLLTAPNTEKVMNAMIQNLQIRIEVLNRQLEVLQKIEKLQKQTTEESLSNETNV